MSKRRIPASDSRPKPISWVRISEPFSSHLQNLEEDEVNATSLITFPTDQVPQPVTRDTIATTTMAASTDSRGSACLPQSAPTVQAQVFSTVAGCVSCDDCTHVNLNATKRHNQAETRPDDASNSSSNNNDDNYSSSSSSIGDDDDDDVVVVMVVEERSVDEEDAAAGRDSPMKEFRGARAGLPGVLRPWPRAASPSVIAASSRCGAGGSDGSKSRAADATANTSTKSTINTITTNNINKMQSVNVTSSITTITNRKSNDKYMAGERASAADNCLLYDECITAVTVPNTKPQRNTGDVAPHNNSDKSVAVVNLFYYRKNYHGALNRSATEQLNHHHHQTIPTSPTHDHHHDSDIPAQTHTYLRTDLDRTTSEPITYNEQHATTTDISFERLVALSKRTRDLERRGLCPVRVLRLCGGGESSLSTGTTGWGTPPAANANNNNGTNSTGWGSNTSSNQANANNQQNWNNNQNRANAGGQGTQGPPDGAANKANSQNSNMPPQNSQPPTSQANSQGWGQQANKNQQGGSASNGPPTSAPQPVAGSQANASSGQSGGTPTASTKQQLEQLNNIREALFAQDGWGGQHVNQDTNWDIPSSPEPQIKMDGSGPPQWKPTVNNGTDLWEVNLRNGGQPPPQPAQKTPWGHTPSTNIGGTWGEDDDVADSSNVWTGVPNNQQQWGGSTNGPMWAPKKETEWGNGGWGDPRTADPRSAATGLDPRDMRIDPRDIRAGSSDPMRMLDPRDQMRLVNSEMRGDPRGITGRLNGAGAETMWGQPPQGPHHLHHQPGKMVGPAGNGAGVNQWAGPPPKELSMSGKPTGWEEPSPPSQRRNMPNYDDGTSLWGNPAQQGRVAGKFDKLVMDPIPTPELLKHLLLASSPTTILPKHPEVSGGNLSHWKELPTGPSGVMGRGAAAMGCPPGMAQSRLKPDGSVWGARNGSWEDGSGHAGWDESNKWNDGGPSWPKSKAALAGPIWDPDMDWGHKQGPKQLTKEMVWNSKQFRLLVDMGYKKEDAESALRARDMNLEDALDLLGLQRSSIDGWRTRHDEHFDHQNTGPFPGQRFGPTGPSAQMPFPPSGNPSLLNSMNTASASTNNPPLASINNMSPAIVHKMLNQGASTQAFGNTAAAGRSLQPQSQPSTQQLRMLVQQIQMAVQAGYLNHQILNQPLAPQTLLLLNQLLQQIKNLQQLMAQQQMAQTQGTLGKPNSQMVLQCSVLITKTKQQIQNLQNQIAAQQALYVKQQQHVGGGGASATPADFFKTNMHDSINALQSNFGELSITKDPQVSAYQNQQSRLNQWKLPSLDKESEPGNEFSRAPGSVAKPLAPSHSSPNLNPLGLGQSDGPWSSGRAADTGGWPDPGTGADPGPPDVTKDSQWPAQAQPSLTDLVPEFEPGKPWKGNQIKSIEDDPSITPGSVVRSPLSLATIKDSEIFNNSTAPSKPSPPGVSSTDTIQPLSLSSSTWSFNPPTTTPSAFTRLDDPLSKIASSKGTWGDAAPPPTNVTSELWGAPMAKSRGPPPGLAKGASNISLVSANGWTSASVGGGRGVSSWATQAGSGNWGSPWLLLRNLTAQIDGSTLRTLCMQHGPLQSFHLYLHQGFALVKYSSREEATKAQTALNNCVLGNTTILAESPTETDVNNLLQQLAPQQSASTGGWRGSGKQTTADTWNTGWSTNPTSSTLWGATPMDSTDPARATPSSLNSFLPGDLLGGESM